MKKLFRNLIIMVFIFSFFGKSDCFSMGEYDYYTLTPTLRSSPILCISQDESGNARVDVDEKKVRVFKDNSDNDFALHLLYLLIGEIYYNFDKKISKEILSALLEDLFEHADFSGFNIDTVWMDEKDIVHIECGQVQGEGVVLSEYCFDCRNIDIEELKNDPQKIKDQVTIRQQMNLSKSDLYEMLTECSKSVNSIYMGYIDVCNTSNISFVEKMRELLGNPDDQGKPSEITSTLRSIKEAKKIAGWIEIINGEKEVSQRKEALKKLERKINSFFSKKINDSVIINITGRSGTGKTTIANIISSGIADVETDQIMVMHSDQLGDNVMGMNEITENRDILHIPLKNLTDEAFEVLQQIARKISMMFSEGKTGDHSFLDYYRIYRLLQEDFDTIEFDRREVLEKLDYFSRSINKVDSEKLEYIARKAHSFGIDIDRYDPKLSMGQVLDIVEWEEFLDSVKENAPLIDPVKIFIVEGTYSRKGHDLFNANAETLNFDIDMLVEVDEATRKERIKARGRKVLEEELLLFDLRDAIYYSTVDRDRETVDIILDNNRHINDYQIIDIDGIIMQFGIPAETAKDNLRREILGGGSVPDIFVLPEDLFYGGKNFADIEFVLYYNYFIKQKKKVTLVGKEEQLERLRTYLQFSLFGPEHDSEMFKKYDPDTQRFLKTAFEEYAVTGENGRKLELDDYVNFVPFEKGDAIVRKSGDRIKIQRISMNRFLAQKLARKGEEQKKHFVSIDYRAPVTVMPKISQSIKTEFLNAPRKKFAITPIGTSDGFDINGDYTSFIMWINGQGIFVDPSPRALDCLERIGIDDDIIPYVLLTHTHADHDGGLLRKILSKRRIKLLTSEPVYDSFVAKTKALLGKDYDVKKWIDYIELEPGKGKGYEFSIGGSDKVVIETRKNLHPIPTIGFRIKFNDSEIGEFGYSGDTEYDSEKIGRLLKDEKITLEEANDLKYFFWDENGLPKVKLLFHEMGGSPIHTKHENLSNLSNEVKEIMYIVHAAEDKIPEGTGLKKAQAFKTYELLASDEDRDMLKERTIEMASRVIANLTFEKRKKILKEAVTKKIKKGKVIIRQGDPIDECSEFYIVNSGQVGVYVDEEWVCDYYWGDCFGEVALEQNIPRTATITAASDVELLALDKEQYIRLISNPEVKKQTYKLMSNIGTLERFVRRVRRRTKDNVFARLKMIALRHLSDKVEIKRYKAGDVIVKQGDPGDELYVVRTGKARVEKNGKRIDNYTQEGECFGEIALINKGVKRTATVVAETDMEVMALKREPFNYILTRYPGFRYSIEQLGLKRMKALIEMDLKEERQKVRDMIFSIFSLINSAMVVEEKNKVVGLELSWMLGLGKEGSRPVQQAKLQKLTNQIIDIFNKYSKGTIKIVLHENDDDEFVKQLLKEGENAGGLEHVMVLGSQEKIISEEFNPLRSSEAETKATLVGVDAKHLSEDNHFRIVDMIEALLILHDCGRINGNIKNIMWVKVGPGQWWFIPSAEQVNLDVYDIQSQEIDKSA